MTGYFHDRFKSIKEQRLSFKKTVLREKTLVIEPCGLLFDVVNDHRPEIPYSESGYIKRVYIEVGFET